MLYEVITRLSAPPPPGDTPAAGRPKSSSWMLGLRVASGILFVPLLIALAWAGGFAFLSFVALEVTLGIIEFCRMMRGKGYRPYSYNFV